MLKWIKNMFQSAEEVAPVVVQKREVKPKDISTPVLEIGAAFLNNPKRFKMKHNITRKDAYELYQQAVSSLRFSGYPPECTAELFVRDRQTGLTMTFRGRVTLNNRVTEISSFVSGPLSDLLQLDINTVNQHENPTWMTRDEAQYLVRLFVESLIVRERKVHVRQEDQDKKRAVASRAIYEKRVAQERERITKLYKED